MNIQPYGRQTFNIKHLGNNDFNKKKKDLALQILLGYLQTQLATAT